MTKQDLPSPDLLRKLFKYNSETGDLFWMPREVDMFGKAFLASEHTCKRWNTKYAGKRAFTSDNGMGYLIGAIFGRKFYAHRVVWALHHGARPKDQIDHINGNKSDNRIANLRIVSQAQNARNQKRHKTNNSGTSGVYWEPSRKKWRARINDDNGRKSLGYFCNKSEAIIAVTHARIEIGYHGNHGK